MKLPFARACTFALFVLLWGLMCTLSGCSAVATGEVGVADDDPSVKSLVDPLLSHTVPVVATFRVTRAGGVVESWPTEVRLRPEVRVHPADRLGVVGVDPPPQQAAVAVTLSPFLLHVPPEVVTGGRLTVRERDAKAFVVFARDQWSIHGSGSCGVALQSQGETRASFLLNYHRSSDDAQELVFADEISQSWRERCGLDWIRVELIYTVDVPGFTLVSVLQGVAVEQWKLRRHPLKPQSVLTYGDRAAARVWIARVFGPWGSWGAVYVRTDRLDFPSFWRLPGAMSQVEFWSVGGDEQSMDRTGAFYGSIMGCGERSGVEWDECDNVAYPSSVPGAPSLGLRVGWVGDHGDVWKLAPSSLDGAPRPPVRLDVSRPTFVDFDGSWIVLERDTEFHVTHVQR